VAIGRAIVRKPDVFLFDEPLSNLDAALRVRMRYEFAKLHEDLKATMIYVTHDQVEAMTLADRIVVLSVGKIEQVGSPLELYEHPANLFVAGFIGSPRMNFIKGEIADASATHALVRLGDGALVRADVNAAHCTVGDAVTLGIRPEHFSHALASNDATNKLVATVTFVESLGSTTHAYCVFPGVEDALTVELDGAMRVQSGEALALTVSSASCYVFTEDGIACKRLSAPELLNQGAAVASRSAA
jgi:multiple sugar transport system ATP-binding protein